MFGLLRRAYDGHVTRDISPPGRLAAGNPEQLSWSGRLTVVGAVTGAIDRYSVHADQLGPRWVYVRIPELDAQTKRRASDRARKGGLDQYRKDARAERRRQPRGEPAMRPGVTALLDQADAASTEAARILAAIGALDGTPVRHTRPGAVFTAIIGKFRTRALAGQLTLCPHLSWTAPEPAFWCAWAPGRLRCAGCAGQAQARIRGTAKDRRCDHCRKTGAAIHPDMAQLPAVVVNLPPYPAKCVPPVTLMFGLCPACQQADKAQPS